MTYKSLSLFIRTTVFMPRCLVLLALKFEELVYGGHRGGITRPDSHFPSPHAIDGRVADSRASCAHHRRSRHVLRVDLERLREIPRPKRSRDVAHVRANRLDAGTVRRIHVEDHAAAVGQILEDMCGRVLIDAHDVCAARLHRGKIVTSIFGARASAQYSNRGDNANKARHRVALLSDL